MMDTVRKTMETALGAPAKAQQVARSVVKDGGKEQVQRTAADLMAWSARSRERLTAMIREEVRSQLAQLGVASRDEVEALRKRVRELEKARSTRKRTTKRTTRRPSTVEQPPTTAGVVSLDPDSAEQSEPVVIAADPEPVVSVPITSVPVSSGSERSEPDPTASV